MANLGLRDTCGHDVFRAVTTDMKPPGMADETALEGPSNGTPMERTDSSARRVGGMNTGGHR